MELNMILWMVGGLVVLGGLVAVVVVKTRTAYLGPVKEELQKEKMWLRRGEYNAAMVKGRQNLELLLKLVAEKNGIQLDNTAQAVANAKDEKRDGRKNRGGHGKEKKVMTHQQFNRWLSENGYLDRVARWEMNQVRIIGNKAVHENYADKDDAWNQYNYLEDILKTVTERRQKSGKRQERKGGEQPERGEQQKNVQVRGGQKAKRKKTKVKASGKAQRGADGQQKAQVTGGAAATPASEKVAGEKTQTREKMQAGESKVEDKPRKRRHRRRKPSGEKAEGAAVPVEKRAEQPTDPKAAQTQKKEKKPAEVKAKKEAKQPTEPQAKKEIKQPGESGEQKTSKRRRRRRRKPQSAQSNGVTAPAKESKEKNEIV